MGVLVGVSEHISGCIGVHWWVCLSASVSVSECISECVSGYKWSVSWCECVAQSTSENLCPLSQCSPHSLALYEEKY